MRVFSAVAAAATAVLLAPAGADASQLVSDCDSAFQNLCRVRPDGTGLRHLTTDGGASRATGRVYQGAAISRDGRKLAYVYDANVFTRDVAGGPALSTSRPFRPALARFRPDGVRFAVAEVAAALGSTQLCAYNTDMSGPDNGRDCVATGVSSGMDYLPDGRLVMAGSGGARRTAGTSSPCSWPRMRPRAASTGPS